jgi:hypothetical protein
MAGFNNGMYYEIADRIKCVTRIIRSHIQDSRVVVNREKWYGFLQAAIGLLDTAEGMVTRKVDSPLELQAVDRSCWLFEIVNELLIEHPEVIHDAKATKLANAAADSLWLLYQHLGAKNIKPDEFKPNKPANKGIRKRTKRPV